MIVVGIVGSPAGGKSTVAGILAELGGTWVDADKVAREVLQQPDVEAQVIAHFGGEIASDGGRIDRSRLAAKVFGDDDASRAALTYLESVIHPRTRVRITERLREEFERDPFGALVLLDIPLLFEAGWDRWCDEIICVDCPDAIRQARARARGWSDDELGRRERNQWPIAEKKRLSTWVLVNDQDLSVLRSRLQTWLTKIIAYQASRPMNPNGPDPYSKHPSSSPIQPPTAATKPHC